MKYSFDGFNYLIRLDKGEKLGESLEKFVSETKIEGAWVNALGAVSEVTLRIYDLDNREYHSQTFKGAREAVSLTGNIAFDEEGKLVWHIHGVFGDDKYQTVGGHVQDLTAPATLEIFVHRAYQPTKRKMDEEVGLKTLDL